MTQTENGSQKCGKLKKGTLAFFKDLSRDEWLTLGVIGLAQFCSQVTFSCIVPFFPTEAAQKGLSTTQIGLLIGIFQLVSFLAAPILGKFMTQLGSKRLFVVGLLIAGFSVTLFGFLRILPSGPVFFWAALLIRVIKALGSSCFATSSLTIVAQAFPGKISSVMSLIEIFAGIGFTAGPLLGSGLYELGGFSLPFFVLGSVMLASSLISLLSLMRNDEGEKVMKSKIEVEKIESKEKTGKDGGWRILAIPEIWLTFWGLMTMEISCFFYDASLANHLADLNGGPMLVSLMISVVSATYLLSAPICGMFVNLWPEKSAWIMLGGSMFAAFAVLLMGPSPVLPIAKSIPSMLSAYALMGFALSPIWIPSFQYCIDSAKERGFDESGTGTCGLISGLLQGALSLGGFLGATLGGVLVSLIKFPSTTTVIASLHMIWSSAQLAFSLQKYWKRKRRGRISAGEIESEGANNKLHKIVNAII